MHAAVLGNQVIPCAGRRHLPLPVSTACGLYSPLPLVLGAGDCVPTAQLQRRESECEAVSDPGWQLPPPQGRLSSLVCPRAPRAAPPAAFRAQSCSGVTSLCSSEVGFDVCDPQTVADPLPAACQPGSSLPYHVQAEGCHQPC